ncbi:sugar nucleotide-binding protein [Candidatus Pacearchaeota archaeon]|jgi:dTDP-4-dehydrorhamnose reductase|nr:sugar nucleotide-binding protein [Candidatus Pacearchaeota archaeon]
MKTIAVLGVTGMIGNAVYNKLKNDKSFIIKPFARNIQLAKSMGVTNCLYFGALGDSFNSFHLLIGCDYVINCIGVIRPFMKQNLSESIYVNSVFPWNISTFCRYNNIKFIHITTDCVFSGISGPYCEDDLHDPLDEYGKSKSLGEPNNCLALRTSMIGEEQKKKIQLLEWAISKKGKTIKGYTNHFWNGMTVLTFAKIINKIISDDLYKEGLYHLYTLNNIVSKYEILHIMNDVYKLELEIEPFETPIGVNRVLYSVRGYIDNFEYCSSSIEEQIKELCK